MMTYAVHVHPDLVVRRFFEVVVGLPYLQGLSMYLQRIVYQEVRYPL